MSTMQDLACHARAAFPVMCAENTGTAWALGPNRDLHFLRTRAGNLHPGSLWESVTAHSEKVMILPVADISA